MIQYVCRCRQSTCVCLCVCVCVDIPGQHQHAHAGDARGRPGPDSSPRSLCSVQQSFQDRLSTRRTLRMCLDRSVDSRTTHSHTHTHTLSPCIVDRAQRRCRPHSTTPTPTSSRASSHIYRCRYRGMRPCAWSAARRALTFR